MHVELRREGCGLPFPVGQHRCRGHQQYGLLQFLFHLEVLQEGQQLDRFAQAHVIG
ncbi:MAG: Uncharacterised protein [Cyanobium sp. ARS6]|nr:MAG: Uncharacterised protein [Cyanobium sp. ARS6]